jgi:gamma-glutamyltranspeptidase/glutathione hydrolase
VSRLNRTILLSAGIFALISATPAQAAEISPAKWPAADRELAEKQEAAGWTPSSARSISGKKGVISAIASPIAVHAGLEALRQGGTAADAAATVALTE